MRVDKLSMSWYQQWEMRNSFAVCRGLKSVTCCMSKQSTWKSKWKVCWDSRKPEKNWLQSRKKLQSIFDFTKKNERKPKTFWNTEFQALFFNWELSAEILESCICNMWCVLQIIIRQKSSHKEHMHSKVKHFPLENKHCNNKKKQNCEDHQLA